MYYIKTKAYTTSKKASKFLTNSKSKSSVLLKLYTIIVKNKIYPLLEINYFINFQL